MKAKLPDYVDVLLEGYAESPNYDVLRSDMDNSVAKQRPRRTLPIVARQVKLLVGNTQNKLAFDQWFRNDIHGGSNFFEFVDPIDKKTKMARFVNGTIKWSTPGSIWFIDAELESVG